jgi:hypothetical protein
MNCNLLFCYHILGRCLSLNFFTELKLSSDELNISFQEGDISSLALPFPSLPACLYELMRSFVLRLYVTIHLQYSVTVQGLFDILRDCMEFDGCEAGDGLD